jgi:hypothetical protein
MLALGAFNSAGTPGEANALRDLTNAKALAYTCWQMYERHATGISPEFVVFPGGADLQASTSAPFYILRPEAAEALYVLHQLTGNPVYREWGWKMFQAIEKYCKTQFGYGAHPDVRDTSRTPDDRMERCGRCARFRRPCTPPRRTHCYYLLPPPPPPSPPNTKQLLLSGDAQVLVHAAEPRPRDLAGQVRVHLRGAPARALGVSGTGADNTVTVTVT